MEEQAIISCLLQKPNLIYEVSSNLKPEYFTDDFCREVYKEFLADKNISIPDLIRKGYNHKILFEYETLIPIVTAKDVQGYGFGIFAKWKKEQLQKLDVNDPCFIQKVKDIDLLDYKVIEENNGYDDFINNLNDLVSGKDDLRNLPTGFNNIDSQIKGLRKSELIIIGGRPASGKTMFGMNLVLNFAKQQKRTLFFSLEMNRIELLQRIAKSVFKIENLEKINQHQFDKIVQLTERLKKADTVRIFDKAGMTTADIIATATREAKKGNVDAVVIDHLAILKSDRNFKSKYEEVSYITAQLKILARELDIPVITLAQLNRGLESRETKAPMLSDLRDSGSIEQDADLIFFIYRPEYHIRQAEPDDKNSQKHIDWELKLKDAIGKAKIILAKNRRGYIGDFDFTFDGKTCNFYEKNY